MVPDARGRSIKVVEPLDEDEEARKVKRLRTDPASSPARSPARLVARSRAESPAAPVVVVVVEVPAQPEPERPDEPENEPEGPERVTQGSKREGSSDDEEDFVLAAEELPGRGSSAQPQDVVQSPAPMDEEATGGAPDVEMEDAQGGGEGEAMETGEGGQDGAADQPSASQTAVGPGAGVPEPSVAASEPAPGPDAPDGPVRPPTPSLSGSIAPFKSVPATGATSPQVRAQDRGQVLASALRVKSHLQPGLLALLGHYVPALKAIIEDPYGGEVSVDLGVISEPDFRKVMDYLATGVPPVALQGFVARGPGGMFAGQGAAGGPLGPLTLPLPSAGSGSAAQRERKRNDKKRKR